MTSWNFQNGFNGGSSFEVEFKGAGPESLLLYQGLNTAVTAKTVLSVIYQPVNNQSDFQLCVGTSTGASQCFALDNAPMHVINNWYQKTWPLTNLPGNVISLRLKNNGGSVESMQLGAIYLGNPSELSEAPPAPSKIQSQSAPIKDQGTAGYYHHLVNWSPVSVIDDNNVHYRLFSSTGTFLGETTETEFDIVNENSQNSGVCIETVNGAGLASHCAQGI